MRLLIHEISTAHTPETLVENVRGESGVILLRTSSFDSPSARYSFVSANPFLTFRSSGPRCEITPHASRFTPHIQFGDPWHLLDSLMSRFEMLDEIDLPFPLGGCFGYWGYDLKNFTEPKLPRRVVNDLELPDCLVGFYDSLVVFDHQLGKTWIVSTGFAADGARNKRRAKEQVEFWEDKLVSGQALRETGHAMQDKKSRTLCPISGIVSNFSRADFLAAVERAQRYIRAGDIYQVNLSQRLTAKLPRWGEAPNEPALAHQSGTSAAREVQPSPGYGATGSRPTRSGSSGWELFRKLSAASPAPFSAFLDCGDFQIASSSPELFLRLSGADILTRPIKGTRPRDADPVRDAQLAYELQTNAKELAELVMITDLLRNDLGKVCEFGSVQTPELARLERFAQVQHLVSTVEGRLRKDVTHFAALASCFPGGSITGAPKFRAMEIIDELETIARGPYCGCHGYLGFNRESQLSITIRTAVCKDGLAHFNVGAGIVADSNPEAEYEETLAKGQGFLAALELGLPDTIPTEKTPT
jgi:para-aminobenzoate synthetase component 1